MSVVSVLEGRTGQYGNATLDVRVFTVVFDTMANGSVAAARVADDGVTAIPAKGTPRPGRPTLIVDDITARPVGPGLMWEVVVNYVGWETGQGEPDPLAQAAEIHWGYETVTDQYDYDYDGLAVMNSAKECLDPPPTREVYDDLVTIVKNVSEANWAIIQSGKYNGSTNSAPVTVDDFEIGITTVDEKDFGKGKITVESERIVRGSYSYRRVTFQIRIRDDGWSHRILDQGFRDIEGNTFLDKNGNERSMPTKLDLAGRESATAEWFRRRPSPQKSWSDISGFFA